MGWGPFDLEGRRAIVTGGAMGIGFGIVERFVEAGADVLIADIDEAKATAASSKLAGGRGRAAAMQVDVAADDAGDRLVAKCVEEFGGIDILVNNAGIYPQVPVLQMPPEILDRVYRINLRGLILISKAVGQRFVDQGTGGKIINIGSIDSLHPSMVGLAAYDSSKGGVLMFTRNFALEMAQHGVSVTAIAPGGINTEGTSGPLEGSGLSAEEQKAIMDGFAQRIPMRRMGEPDDIAKVAVFLASSASDYMTGEIVVVDGGMLLA